MKTILSRLPLLLLALALMLLAPAAIALADDPAPVSDAGGPEGSRVVFEGSIQARPTEAVGTWTIEGRAVTATTRTQFLPNAASLAVGDAVRVVAERRQGELVAQLIAKTPQRERMVVGKIEALPADGVVGVWKIAGQDINVTAETRLQGDDPDVGDGATAWVTQTDAGLAARQILVKDAPTRPPLRPVVFRGAVTAIEGATWTIRTDRGDVTVLTDDHTHIVGAPVVGDAVGVKGKLSEGDVVLAQLIVKLENEHEEIEFAGFVTELLATPQGAAPSVLPNTWAWKVERPAYGDAPAASWVVIVREETRINVKPGEVAVGAWIKGAGLLIDAEGNTVEAKVVRVTPAPRVRFSGAVTVAPAAETFPLGDWTIGGVLVHVTSDTTIEGDAPALGATANGFGDLQADGSVKAIYLRASRR